MKAATVDVFKNLEEACNSGVPGEIQEAARRVVDAAPALKLPADVLRELEEVVTAREVQAVREKATRALRLAKQQKLY